MYSLFRYCRINANAILQWYRRGYDITVVVWRNNAKDKDIVRVEVYADGRRLYECDTELMDKWARSEFENVLDDILKNLDRKAREREVEKLRSLFPGLHEEKLEYKTYSTRYNEVEARGRFYHEECTGKQRVSSYTYRVDPEVTQTTS